MYHIPFFFFLSVLHIPEAKCVGDVKRRTPPQYSINLEQPLTFLSLKMLKQACLELVAVVMEIHVPPASCRHQIRRDGGETFEAEDV